MRVCNNIFKQAVVASYACHYASSSPSTTPAPQTIAPRAAPVDTTTPVTPPAPAPATPATADAAAARTPLSSTAAPATGAARRPATGEAAPGPATGEAAPETDPSPAATVSGGGPFRGVARRAGAARELPLTAATVVVGFRDCPQRTKPVQAPAQVAAANVTTAKPTYRRAPAARVVGAMQARRITTITAN